MVHHHQSPSGSRVRQARRKLIKSCDIYLVLILSSQALQSEVCCLSSGLKPIEKPGNSTSTLKTNDFVASPQNHQEIKRLLRLNTTSTLQVPPTSVPTATRKTLTYIRRKIMRRRKNTDDMNTAPLPLVEDLTDGGGELSTATTTSADGGGLLYGDDYLEDGLELTETPPDLSSPYLHPANGHSTETGNSSSSSNVINASNDIDIERLVRSQVNMAATNFATLRPDEYQAPTFNDTIQGLDLNSYLSNFADSTRQEHDHATPEESATVKVKHQLEDFNLFYPNHNYKYDQDTDASPFRSSKLVDFRKTASMAVATTTIDPLTASSDESNKYGSMPRATEQYSPPTGGPLLRPADDDLQNYPNQVQHALKYAPITRFSGRNKQSKISNANPMRPIKTSHRDDKMNQLVVDQQQEQTQIDRPATVELGQGIASSSGNLNESNVHGSSLDQLNSKGFTDDQHAARDHMIANQQQLGLASNVQRLPYSRTGFKSIHPHLLYGMMNDKLQTVESLRVEPSSTPTSATLKPTKMFKRPYKISIKDQSKLLHPSAHAIHPNLSHLNINGSLAARLLVNRYKSWPLRFANLTTTTTTTAASTTTPKQILLDPNLQKLLHAHYGLEVPPFVPISPLAKLHSATDIQAAKIFPWQPTTTTTPSSSNTRPTISFTKATTPMMMMMSPDGGKTPTVSTPAPASASASGVMVRSSSLMTNSTKPLGSRAHLRQAPAQHHHHHSHVHSIKPSLISIPIPLQAVPKYHHPPSANYYDSLLAAAAAAAAASADHSHKLSRGQQVLAQSLLSQPYSGVPVRLPPNKHQHYPPGTIPIGGTLASTRGHPTSSTTKSQHQRPVSASTNGNSDGNIDGMITTTYQSGLLAHLLEAANRALKQVAGNTASLLNLQGSSSSHNQLLEASTQAPSISTTQRGSEYSASDYFEPLESQLHTIGLYQAPTDESSPLGAYLTALLSSTSDLYNQPGNRFKDTVEPVALASPNLLEWTDISNQTSDSSEVMLASLGSNSNLLYPILTHSSTSNSEGSSQSGHGLTKSALVSLLDSDDQTDNSNPVSAFDSPRHQYWSKPLLSPPPPGQRIIPLKQPNAGSSNNKTLVSTAQSSSKFKSNYQEEDLQNSSHHYPAPSAGKKGSQKDGDSGAGSGVDQQMPYAVTHYIGESPSLGSVKSQGGTRGGENMVYSIIEPEFIHNTNAFHPVVHHHKRPIRGSGLHKTGELVLSSPIHNGAGANPLDNLSGQPHVYSFSDNPFGTGTKTILTGDESKKSNSIRALMGGGEDYRANESKGEEHVVSIVPESSLNPHNKHPDPLELLLHLTSGGLKPHLMAASDIVNYHKLKFIHHYLQHHIHGHDHMSEAARLAVGGQSPKAQLMLAFWPIIFAIIPIMIIVAIVVQLVLAAPLVLFAMTTLTVARFATAVFGPMFSREDVSSFSVKSGTSPRPKLAAIPSNNFLYSMLKMETRPPRYSKTTTTTSLPSSTTSTSTTSKPQRRRRRRRHLLSQSENFLKYNELEDYFESLL